MIGFAGLSHLGLVSSIGVASKNIKVLGYDSRDDLVAHLNNSKLPLFEPSLDELLLNSKKNISFTSKVNDLSNCKLVYLSIDVRTNDDNTSDLTGIKRLLEEVGPVLAPGTTLVILSQVPPGFTRTIKIPQVKVYYQVETLIFGSAVERTLKPERYIIGCEDPKTPLPTEFQKLLMAFDCPCLPMRYESAELAKISINMFLSSTLGMTNTLAEICEKMGADWNEIAPAMRLDKRIGPHAYLAAGLGISGGNIERDLISLSRLGDELRTDTSVVKACIENSKYRKQWPQRVLSQTVLGQMENPRVAIWGIAYKQNTNSVKNSPSIELLSNLPKISVTAYDPEAKLPGDLASSLVTQVSDALAACDGADVLVIMTPWDEFKKIPVPEIKRRLRGNTIIDPFGVLNESQCHDLGLKYQRLGAR